MLLNGRGEKNFFDSGGGERTRKLLRGERLRQLWKQSKKVSVVLDYVKGERASQTVVNELNEESAYNHMLCQKRSVM